MSEISCAVLVTTYTHWHGVGGGERRRESETEREFEFVFGRWGGGEARVIMAQATTYVYVRRWPDGVLVERTNSWPGFGRGGGGGGGEGGGGGGGGSGPTLGFARRGEREFVQKRWAIGVYCVPYTLLKVAIWRSKGKVQSQHFWGLGVLFWKYCAGWRQIILWS